MKRRVILTALLAIVLCLCLVSGATYALFTSESKVDITVSSGKVKVTSVVENLKIYSMNEEQVDTFENGGTVDYTDGVLKIEKMTPGDKVEFDIKVTNSSNIDIKYRLKWSVDGKLGEALVAKANDEELKNVYWTLWEANATEKEFVYKVVVELPVETGNEYQEQSCEIVFLVEAIQANGLLVNYVTPATLEDALANAQDGDEIELSAGYYDEIVVPQNNMKFFTQEGAEVGFIDVNGKSGITIEGLKFDAANAKAVYDASKGGVYRGDANIAGAATASKTIGAQNLTIDGCTFTGEFVDGGYAIAFTDRARSTGGSGNITIKNCKFATSNSSYDIYGYYTGVPGLGFVIENNEFSSKCFGKAIYLGRLKTSEAIVIKENTFANADTLEKAVTIAGDSGYTPTIDSANNSFGSYVKYVNPSTIANALASVEEGTVIELAAGYYDEIVVPQNGIKLFTQEGAEVGFLNINGKDNVTIQGLKFDAANAKVVYDGKGNGKQYTSIALASGKQNGKGALYLVIDNCTFTGQFANGGVSIGFVDQGRTTGQSGYITIKNCNFETTNGYYDIYCHYSGKGTLIIENNTFNSTCLGNSIFLGRYQSATPVAVKGNKFLQKANLTDSVYLQDHSNYGVSLDVTNNTFK